MDDYDLQIILPAELVILSYFNKPILFVILKVKALKAFLFSLDDKSTDEIVIFRHETVLQKILRETLKTIYIYKKSFAYATAYLLFTLVVIINLGENSQALAHMSIQKPVLKTTTASSRVEIDNQVTTVNKTTPIITVYPTTQPVVETQMVQPIAIPTLTPTQVNSSSLFQYPLSYTRITTYFSWYHQGIDFAAPLGTPVYAAMDGTVTRVSIGTYDTGYGNNILISQGEYRTRYAHLERVDVGYGEYVNKGTLLGLVGSTGNSTGSHLHFEVYQSGVHINPFLVLP